MDWVECNICSKKPKEIRIYVTSCGHIICDSCNKSGTATECAECSKKCQFEEICAKMRPHVLELFRDPRELATILMKEFHGVIQFQAAQREKATKLRQNMASCEMKKLKMMKEENDKLSKQFELERRTCTEMHEKIKATNHRKEELKMRLAELHKKRKAMDVKLKRRVSKSKTEPLPTKKLSHRFPSKIPVPFVDGKPSEAPNLECLFKDDENNESSHVTSTPISNIEASRREYMKKMFTGGNVNPSPIM